MKRLLLAALLFLPGIALADAQRAAGATSQCFTVFISDSSSTVGAGLTGLAYNSGSLTCYYYRQNAGTGATAITLANSTLGTYTSGALKQIDATNLPGDYEFCPPDAALASAAGVNEVMFQCKGASNMAPMNLRVNLIGASSFGYDGKLASESGTILGLASAAVDADDQFNDGFAIVVYDSAGLVSAKSCITDSANTGDTVTTAADISSLVAVNDSYIIQPDAGCSANIAKWSGTAIPATHTAGYPIVTIKDGTGTGEIDTLSGAIQAVASSTTCGTTNALGATAKSDVNAEVVDVIRTDTVAELSACPASTATLNEKVTYLYQYFRHKLTSTSAAMTLYKDDGSTTLCSDTLSDNGTTFTRGEMN